MKPVFKDALFGAIGGMAGTFVITAAMGTLKKAQNTADQQKEQALVPEEPTEKFAGRASEQVGVILPKDKKASLGQVVHWSYGITWGAIYGILRKRFPVMARGAGLPFGVSFSLLGEGVLLPMMGLTPPAAKFPASVHVRDTASHYAYAATVEGICLLCEKVEEKLREKEEFTNDELRHAS